MKKKHISVSIQWSTGWHQDDYNDLDPDVLVSSSESPTYASDISSVPDGFMLCGVTATKTVTVVLEL